MPGGGRRQAPYSGGVTLSGFVERFRALHEQRKKGALPEPLRVEYEAGRRELTRLMLAAQQASVDPKRTPRGAVRAAFVTDVTLELGSGPPEGTETLDVGSRGFAALVAARCPEVGATVRFTLHLGRSVRGTAKVASRRPQGGRERVGFVFDTLEGDGRDALDAALVDYLLSRL